MDVPYAATTAPELPQAAPAGGAIPNSNTIQLHDVEKYRTCAAGSTASRCSHLQNTTKALTWQIPPRCRLLAAHKRTYVPIVPNRQPVGPMLLPERLASS